MANFKLTISDKKGKSLTKELKDSDANPLLGLEIGNETDASVVGFTGKLKITGGSDKSGVPMRHDIHGSSRKYVLLTKGVGLQDTVKGERVRKLTRGNTISEEIYQINCKFDGDMPIEKAPETKEAPKTKPETKEAPKTKPETKEAPKTKPETKEAPKTKPETKADSTPKDKNPKKKE